MADISNIASRLYNETQAPERAIIIFHNVALRTTGKRITIKNPDLKSIKTPFTGLSPVKVTDNAVYQSVQNNLSSLETFSYNDKAKEGYIDTLKVKRQDYSYRVMFNPSSIKLSAFGGGLVEKRKYNKNGDDDKDFTEATSEITYVQNDRRNMTFSVNLIFDQVNPSDAFSQVNPFELSGSVKSAVNAVNNNLRNKDYSIQKEVEGFLSSCRKAETRCITFQMGDMSYTGILYQVSAQYTMFNPNGEPIRAVVYLQMTIVDTSLGYGDMGQFTKSFKDVFDQGQNVSLDTVKNSVSGLFNLDL